MSDRPEDKSASTTEASSSLVAQLRADKTAVSLTKGDEPKHSPSECIDALLAAGCDEQLLDLHLKQIESAMSCGDGITGANGSQIRKTAKALRTCAKDIEAVQCGLFDPVAFARVMSAGDAELASIRKIAVTGFKNLPAEMRRYADFLELQARRVARWRVGWLRGNFALNEAVRLVVDYVRDSSSHSKPSWTALAFVLNALAKLKGFGLWFTPNQLRKLSKDDD